MNRRGCREKPKRCLPARFFGTNEKQEAAGSPPLATEELGCFLCGLGGWLRCLLGLLLGRELLLYLGGDGIAIDLIGGRCFLEDSRRIASRSCQQDAGFHQQPGERSFIGTAYKCREGLLQASIVASGGCRAAAPASRRGPHP